MYRSEFRFGMIKGIKFDNLRDLRSVIMTLLSYNE